MIGILVVTPAFSLTDEDGEEKKLSRRQKLRARKRKMKNKEPESVPPKKARNWAPESEGRTLFLLRL